MVLAAVVGMLTGNMHTVHGIKVMSLLIAADTVILVAIALKKLKD